MSNETGQAPGAPVMQVRKHWEWHRDDAGTRFYDDVRVRLVERWKTSGLSGDEWRFSYVIELCRKGEVRARKSVHDLPYALIEAARAVLGDGPEMMGEAGGWEIVKAWNPREMDSVCHQPGCAATPVVRYLLRKRYEGNRATEVPIHEWEKPYRHFCERHAERGDCAIDDADANYIVDWVAPGFEVRR